MRHNPVVTQAPRPPLTLGEASRWIYNATFSNGSLNPALDEKHIGPLQFGHSELNNPDPRCFFEDDELVQVVTLPQAATGVILSSVTAGVFATPLPFRTQLPFALRGTYVAPLGPQDGQWAVGILARTGGVEDLSTNITQVVATLQFNADAPGTARLNIPLGRTSPTHAYFPPLIYGAIIGANPFEGSLEPLSPVPFSLELVVDRNLARGSATLTVEGQEFSTDWFQLQDLIVNSELTAVGTVIANRSANGATVSVHVQSFEIWAAV